MGVEPAGSLEVVDPMNSTPTKSAKSKKTRDSKIKRVKKLDPCSDNGSVVSQLTMESSESTCGNSVTTGTLNPPKSPMKKKKPRSNSLGPLSKKRNPSLTNSLTDESDSSSALGLPPRGRKKWEGPKKRNYSAGSLSALKDRPSEPETPRTKSKSLLSRIKKDLGYGIKNPTSSLDDFLGKNETDAKNTTRPKGSGRSVGPIMQRAQEKRASQTVGAALELTLNDENGTKKTGKKPRRKSLGGNSSDGGSSVGTNRSSTPKKIRRKSAAKKGGDDDASSVVSSGSRKIRRASRKSGNDDDASSVVSSGSRKIRRKKKTTDDADADASSVGSGGLRGGKKKKTTTKKKKKKEVEDDMSEVDSSDMEFEYHEESLNDTKAARADDAPQRPVRSSAGQDSDDESDDVDLEPPSQLPPSPAKNNRFEPQRGKLESTFSAVFAGVDPWSSFKMDDYSNPLDTSDRRTSCRNVLAGVKPDSMDDRLAVIEKFEQEIAKERAALSDEKASFAFQKESLEMQLTENARVIDDLNKKVKEMERQLQSAKWDANGKNAQELTTLKTENSELHQKLRKERIESESRLNLQEDRIHQLREELMASKRQTTAMRASSHSSSHSGSLDSKLEQMEETISRLEQQVHEKNMELQFLQTTTPSKSSGTSTTEEVEPSTGAGEWKAKVEDLESMVESKNETIEFLMEQLSRLKQSRAADESLDARGSLHGVRNWLTSPLGRVSTHGAGMDGSIHGRIPAPALHKNDSPTESKWTSPWSASMH